MAGDTPRPRPPLQQPAQPAFRHGSAAPRRRHPLQGQGARGRRGILRAEGWIRVQAGKAVDRHGMAVTVKLTGEVETWWREGGGRRGGRRSRLSRPIIAQDKGTETQSPCLRLPSG